MGQEAGGRVWEGAETKCSLWAPCLSPYVWDLDIDSSSEDELRCPISSQETHLVLCGSLISEVKLADPAIARRGENRPYPCCWGTLKETGTLGFGILKLLGGMTFNFGGASSLMGDAWPLPSDSPKSDWWGAAPVFVKSRWKRRNRRAPGRDRGTVLGK